MSWVVPAYSSGVPGATMEKMIHIMIPHPDPNWIRQFSATRCIPEAHGLYVKKLILDAKPQVIYDIGAAVLHWTRMVRGFYPEGALIAFDGTESLEFLYREVGVPYHVGVLTNEDSRELAFYQNEIHPGGNSYYPEAKASSRSQYGMVVKTGMTLDTIVKTKGFPKPDFIKIDVQGAEIDILTGALDTLSECQNLIVELQHTQYNLGAPLADKSIPLIESLGFKLVTPLFCNNGPDGDYHFKRL